MEEEKKSAEGVEKAADTSGTDTTAEPVEEAAAIASYSASLGVKKVDYFFLGRQHACMNFVTSCAELVYGYPPYHRRSVRHA